MTQLKKIPFAIVITTVLFGCSQSSNGGGDDTSTDTSVDTTSDSLESTDSIVDSTTFSETIADSNSETHTAIDSDAIQGTDSDSFIDTATATQTEFQTDSRTDTQPLDSDSHFNGTDSSVRIDSESDTDSDFSDTGTNTNTDSSVESGSDSYTDSISVDDTETDTFGEGDSSTEPIYTDCPDGGVIGCEGKDIWCFNQGTATDYLMSCEDDLYCTKLSSEGVQCQCAPNYVQHCYEGDIWSFDSCGSRERLIEACENGTHCVQKIDGTAECNSCEGYWGGENCDVCLGNNGGEESRCQCPVGDFIPIPGTDVCFTAPLTVMRLCIGVVCYDEEVESGVVHWDEAVDGCPEGFRLPSPDEIAEYLFDGAAMGSDGYDHFSCENYTCSSLGNIQGSSLWTAQVCDSGHMRYIVNGNLYVGELRCADDSGSEAAVCIKK